MYHSLCIFRQMRYIQPFPGQYVSMDPTAVIDVYGLIGTPALWKEHAALVWRVGPSYLFEEALSPEAVGIIYTQGTAYVGNFLALRNTGESKDLVQDEVVSRCVRNVVLISQTFGCLPHVIYVSPPCHGMQ